MQQPKHPRKYALESPALAGVINGLILSAVFWAAIIAAWIHFS